MTGEPKRPNSRRGERRDHSSPAASDANLPETIGPASSHTDTQPQPKTVDEAMPETFGRYHILKRIGQGGMGAVYLAHDTQLDRPVALKVPTFNDDEGRQLVERFYREARAAATLDHPNLCPVHDVGQIGGRHYLTMAYIEGRTLADYMRGDKLFPTRQVAAVIRKIAIALQAAHDRGVIHRDLKPSNIIVNQRREPVIMDFGLAQRLNATDTKLTQTGTIVGTPAYMSPEQISAGDRPVGPASDIYSLGVMMYEMLAGQLPFQGPPFVVLGQIIAVEPESPTVGRSDLEPELAAICLKAMAKQPEQRFESMAELAEALRAFLQQPQEPPTLPVPPVAQPHPTAPPPAGETTLADQFFQNVESVASRRSVSVLRQRERKENPTMIWAAVVGIGLAALIGIVFLFSIASNEGTIKIELVNADRDIEIRIDGKIVPTGDLDRPLSFAPSEHQLLVTGPSIETLDQAFTVRRGRNEPLRVRLSPNRNLAQNNQPLESEEAAVAPLATTTPALGQSPVPSTVGATSSQSPPPPPSSGAVTELPPVAASTAPPQNPLSVEPPADATAGAAVDSSSKMAEKSASPPVTPALPADSAAPVTIDGMAKDWNGVETVEDARDEAADAPSRNIVRTAAVHNSDSLYVMIATDGKPSTDDLAFWLNIDYTGDGRNDAQIGMSNRGDYVLWLFPAGGESTSLNIQRVAYSIDDVVEIRIPWQTIRDQLSPPMTEQLPPDVPPLHVRVTAESFDLATDKRVDYGEPTYSEARLTAAERSAARAQLAKLAGPLKLESIWLRDTGAWDVRYGLDEQSLASTARTLAGRGLALASINGYVDDKGEVQFAGLWAATGGIATTARVDLDRAEFEKAIGDNGSKGLRPVSVDVYQPDGQPRFAAVWANDGNNYSWVWKISDSASLQNDFDTLTQQGYGVVAQSGGLDARGQLTYVTFWTLMSGTRPASYNLPEPEYRQKVSNYGPGMRPVLIDAWRDGSNLMFPVMWAHDGQTITDWHVRSSVGTAQFDNEVTTHRRQGYRLLNLCIIR